MPGLFVTATGTDVGKTFVSAGLIRACRRAGRPVAALKPVLSGFDPADPAASDAAVLIEAMGVPVTPDAIEAVSPWRFRAPLSPDMAAALEGRKLPFGAIAAACRDAVRPDRLTIVEGVGGVMVPLDGARTILDLMVTLAMPAVLVSPTMLGAISHLLTALAAMRARGLEPACVVLSESEGSTVPLAMMAETLRPFWPPERLAILRRSHEDQDAAFTAILARAVPSAAD